MFSLLLAAGIILGIVGFMIIKKHSDIYQGKALALGAVVIGGVMLFLTIPFLLVYLILLGG